MSTLPVAILRYRGGIFKWNVGDMRELDRKTRKLLTIHKDLHSRSNIDRLYLCRKDEVSGLMSCEDVIKSEENYLGWYLKHSNERLLQGVKHVGILEFEKSCWKNDVRESMRERRKETWVGNKCMTSLLEICL